MHKKILHLVSLTIPYPPDYGGVIDIWYKIKALNKAGVQIILHCFEYNREKQDILEDYCKTVYYYPRSRSFFKLFSKEPFIVKTRKSSQLLKNLAKDQNPILIEGIHSVWLAEELAGTGRNIWLRTHNVESEYFNSLLKTETNWWKKVYFYLEKQKLKRYEKKHFPLNGLFCISPPDMVFFSAVYSTCSLITPFHGEEKVTSKIGKGDYLIYHGDLSVSENRQNALYLAEISHNFPQRLVVAGRSPDHALKENLRNKKNVELRENLSGPEMTQLIKNASVILLPAKQTTGFRLKLLHSLFEGRHIVASPQMVEKTGLEQLCHLATTENEWISTIKKMSITPFSSSEKDKREKVLSPFTDISNAKKIIDQIFSSP